MLTKTVVHEDEWKMDAKSIVETGKFLSLRKAEMPKDEFEKMVLWISTSSRW